MEKKRVKRSTNDLGSKGPEDSIRKSMRSNKAAETRPERNLRRALWAAGLRGYRKNYRVLPGKPDIVFTRARVCVFVQGCFWHQCKRCAERRNVRPTRNSAYWLEKLTRNVTRDAQNVCILEAMGWSVVVVWECELKVDLSAAVNLIRNEVRRRQPTNASPVPNARGG